MSMPLLALKPEQSPDKQAKIVVIPGDGIGVEITNATLKVLRAAGANISVIPGMLGKNLSRYDPKTDQFTYIEKAGVIAHVTAREINETLENVARYRVSLKGPTATPKEAKGTKSANVTVRKAFEQYACIRTSENYPFIPSIHPKHTITVFRENVEDLYAAVGHQQTQDMHQELKLLTKSGSEKIIRAAFEYTLAHGAQFKGASQLLTCAHKANINKQTEGMFLEVFNRVKAQYQRAFIQAGLAKDAKDYDVKVTDQMIDISMANLATTPEKYAVLVCTNLFGDIITDVQTAVSVGGSVGMGGSANLGARGAMFEAIAGTAPDIAGQDKANPTGMMKSAVMMLNYLAGDENIKAAKRIEMAMLWTFRDGVFTGDVLPKDKKAKGAKAASTSQFASEICARIEKIIAHEKQNMPLKELEDLQNDPDYARLLTTVPESANNNLDIIKRTRPEPTKAQKMQFHGLDLFVEQTGLEAEVLARIAQKEFAGHSLDKAFDIASFRTLRELCALVEWLYRASQQLLRTNAPQTSLAALSTSIDVTSGLSEVFAKTATLSQLHEMAQGLYVANRDIARASVDVLAEKLERALEGTAFSLSMISNRGLSVYPAMGDPDLVDHFRCRLELKDHAGMSDAGDFKKLEAKMLTTLATQGICWSEIQPLRSFDGDAGWGQSYGQAQGPEWNARINREDI